MCRDHCAKFRRAMTFGLIDMCLNIENCCLNNVNKYPINYTLSPSSNTLLKPNSYSDSGALSNGKELHLHSRKVNKLY